MTHQRKIFVALLSITLLANASTQAQDENYCSASFASRQPTSTFALRTVKEDVKRLHFIDGPSKPGCPSLEESCQLPGFVVGGDKLLVTSINNKRIACVHYFSKAGKLSSGFVDLGSLGIPSFPEDKLNSRAGYGSWSNGYTGLIEIKPGSDDYVIVSGDINRGPPSYNSGTLNGPAFLSPNGDDKTAGYVDDHYNGDKAPTEKPDASAAADTCRARLRLMGDFLIVDDNDRCGGNGVMFTGLYKKKP